MKTSAKNVLITNEKFKKFTEIDFYHTFFMF